MSLSIKLISNIDGLDYFKDSWNPFISNYGRNPFFLAGFVRSLIENYDENNSSISILIGEREKDLVGIAPLLLDKISRFRYAKFFCNPAFSPDFFVLKKYKQIFIEEVINVLFRTLRCHFLTFSLPTESSSPENFKHIAMSKKYPLIFSKVMGHFILPVNTSWEYFESSRPRKYVKEIRRFKRRLNQAGSWQIIRLKNSEANVRIFDIEKRSWKQFWREKREKDFDRDLQNVLEGCRLSSGEPDFNWGSYFIELKKKMIAYLMFVKFKENIFLVKTSFDENFRKFYPGIILMNEAIHDIFTLEIAKKIDFLTNLSFLRYWSPIHFPRTRITIFPRKMLPVSAAVKVYQKIPILFKFLVKRASSS